MVDRHQIESWAHDPLKALVQVTFLLTLKHKIMEKHEVFIGVDVPARARLPPQADVLCGTKHDQSLTDLNQPFRAKRERIFR